MISTVLLLQSAVFAAKMGPTVVAAHEICRMTFILQYIIFAAVELTGQSMVAGRLAEEEEEAEGGRVGQEKGGQEKVVVVGDRAGVFVRGGVCEGLYVCVLLLLLLLRD